jgi:uncharacterized protein YjiS (DUF1127 family)
MAIRLAILYPISGEPHPVFAPLVSIQSGDIPMPAPTRAAPPAPLTAPFPTTGLLARAVATVAGWRARARSRRRLADLPPHLLRDIGLDREAALAESRRPFWER